MFLLCKQNREKQDGYKLLPSPVEFAIGILSRRSEVDARSVLGGLHHEVYRPVDELIANPHNWDTAVLADEYIMMRPKNHDMSFLNDLGITIDGPHPQPDLNEHLKQLVKAGLLYDFSQDEYFSQYAGMITLDGKMVAVSLGLRYPELRHPLYVVNAQSPLLEQALEYIKYRAKSAEWAYENISSNGEWYNRNEMDW